MILTNAFSLSMLDKPNAHIIIKELSKKEVKRRLSSGTLIGKVGHESTANFLSKLLKNKVNYERPSLKLKMNDKVVVAQLSSRRLDEWEKLNEEKLEKIPVTFIEVTIDWMSP